MFNSKRVFGLALISIASALSGCGGGSGQPGFETVCSDGEVLNSEEMCVTRTWVCESGTVYPPGYLPDETSDQDDCVPVEFNGPATSVTPGDNEVILFFNRQHIDADYTGVNLYRFGGCWADGGTPTWPGVQVERAGIDDTYGAYYRFAIDPGCAANETASYIWNYNGDANKTNDLRVGYSSTSSPWNARDFFIPSDAGRLPGSDGGRNGGVATTGIPVCVQPDPSDTVNCVTPAPPARLVKEASFHWISNNVFAHNATGIADVVLYVDETPDGPFDQVPAVDADGEPLDDAGDIIVDDGSASGTGVSVLATLVEDNSEDLPEGYEGWYRYVVSATPDETNTLNSEQVKSYLKDHLMVSYFSSPDLLGTKVQVHTILDELYVGDDASPGAESVDLGITYSDSGITVRTWAPTAQDVDVVVFSAGTPRFDERTVQMIEDRATGVWSVTLPLTDDGKFYRFSLSVVNQGSGLLRRVQTPDPYGVSSSSDSLHSQFVDINSDVLTPDGWDAHIVEDGLNGNLTVADIAIYSGYLRDFTAGDENVSEANRGKYLGLTESTASARSHLAALRAAGITHINFLPLADSFGVTEAEGYRLNLGGTIADFCRRFRSEIKPRSETVRPIGDVCDNTNLEPSDTISDAITQLLASTVDGEEAQAYTILENIQRVDGFNWGYAPILSNVPEGSFASVSDGPTRILELRQMVQAIHAMGLRVSMDVIYSYFSASGFENPKSVMDKLVPGYYVRRDPVTGLNENEAGTPEADQIVVFADSASENAMMADFIKDSLEFWAREYKIDAFRFDGLGSVDTDALVAAQAAADAANTLSPVYVYGTAGNTDEQPGSGIGNYNALMAGELTSLSLIKAGFAAEGEADLRPLDKIRAGLAGNLAAYPFYNSFGAEVTGNDLSVGAYGVEVQENVTYVTYHDNGSLTLWDSLHSTAAGNYGTVDDTDTFIPFVSALDAADRARIQVLSFAIPMLSQGVSSFELGTDLLRSRSMGADNSNSGDWFNYVDFGQTTNGWDVANPFSNTDDADRALGDAAVADVSDEIAWTSDMFLEYLEISNSSPLLKLSSAQDVIDRVGFHNQGVDQTPGVIVMSVDDGNGLTDIDSTYDAIVVVFNGTASPVTHGISTAEGFALHPLHTIAGASFSYDEVEDIGSFTVPALTVAVFVQAEGGNGLSRDASPAPAASAPYGTDQLYLRGSAIAADWGTYANGEFVWVGGDLYELEVPITDAPPANIFKIATRDWGVYEIADAAGTALTLDTPVTLNAGCGKNGLSCSDNSFAFQANTTYLFSLDATNTAEPVLTISIAEDEPYGVPLYLRGFMNGWAAGNAEDLFAYEGYGYYGLTRTTPANTDNITFKIADTDWTTDPASNFGHSGTALIAVGEPTTLANNGGDIQFPVAEETVYYYELNARDDSASPVLTISEAPFEGATLYMRGTHLSDGMGGGWGAATADYAFGYMGDGVYQLDASFDATQLGGTMGAPAGAIRFKIANADWGDSGQFGVVPDEEGGGFGTVTVGDPNNLLGGSNIEWSPVEDQLYRIILDTSGSTPTLRMTPFSE